MTWRKREIMEMARESHMDMYGLGKNHAQFEYRLEAFDKLVREDEREACAKVCETHAPTTTPTWVSYAAAIRARGQK